MARVLIAYATVEGQTARIAEAMRDALAEAGHDPVLLHVADGDEPLPAAVDAAIVGGPIHQGKHLEALTKFATAHRVRLAQLPTGFFTVCLSALDDTPEGREETGGYVQTFCDDTNWTARHTAVFAGRLAWTQYDFFTRLIMKLITKRKGSPDLDVTRDYDYTDYDAVRRFATEVAATPARAGVS